MERIIVALVGVLVAVLPMSAQVNLKFTPEPMAVPTAALSNARDMGRWIVEGCNDGAAPVTLAWERISMTVGIRFIDSDDAVLVLTSNQSKTVAATLVRIGTLAGQGLALGLSVASRSNLPIAAGVGIGASLLPNVIQVVQGQVPSIAPLTAGQKYPIELPPGACFTDHRFAAKEKGVKVVLATMGGAKVVGQAKGVEAGLDAPDTSVRATLEAGLAEGEAKAARFEMGTAVDVLAMAGTR